MDNETTNIGDPLKNYYIFYSAPALLNHKEREFGTVIAEANNKLIIVDDEIIREHVYSIPKSRVDHHYGDQLMHFNIPECSLKDFEI